jgi:DNA-binding FadR family transcriptional regulator
VNAIEAGDPKEAEAAASAHVAAAAAAALENLGLR